MQQGLALGCLILVVCAVVFGIVLRATRAHDLEDPEKVAAAVCDLPTDNRADYDAAAEMLDISTAVEQLQDRIPCKWKSPICSPPTTTCGTPPRC